MVDLDDTPALLNADRDGLLRHAAMAGATVRATAAAVEEGALESLAADQRPRTVIWLARRGPAETAGAMLSAVLGGSAGEPLVTAAQAPTWIGPLDVLVVAGDDPGDPLLASAAATAVRRGARVVVAAPYEGPLRDATAGRAAVLAPRLWTPDEFGLCRYLAAGLATLSAVDPGLATLGEGLNELADELDAEALRNSPDREVFTNPAKALANRMSGRRTVLAGDNPATLALARHGAAVLLRVGGQTTAAAGLADALVALRRAGAKRLVESAGRGAAHRFTDPVDALFHDEEIDGPLPARSRVLALTLADERAMLGARVEGMDDVDVVGVEDVGEAGSVPAGSGGAEQQLATLAVRIEMAAVYLGLAGG
jgi:hypothetical protein